MIRPEGMGSGPASHAILKTIKTLLADDHTIVREGLRSLLRADSGIEVVGEAHNGREAVKLALALRPDIVVMDIAMPLLQRARGHPANAGRGAGHEGHHPFRAQ